MTPHTPQHRRQIPAEKYQDQTDKREQFNFVDEGSF